MNWEYGQYYPIAHIVEGLANEGHFNECPDEDMVYEMVQNELVDMGLDPEYPPILDMEIDLDFDYHDYHAEWNRGFEASIRDW